MSDRHQSIEEPSPSTPSDDRVADPDVESLIDERKPTSIPDEERAVPEDVNEYVADEHENEI